MMRRGLTLVLALSAFACGDDEGDPPGMITDAGPDRFGNSAGNATRDGSTFMPRDGAVREPPTCGNSPFGASLANVNVLLVIDKSGSMLETPQGFATDKWSAMKSSLGAALGAVERELHLGLSMYPAQGCDVSDDAEADVPVAAGPEALPMIEEALDLATPSGGTPTAAALSRALAYFTEGDGNELSGDRYVLLATDGGPNCNDGLMCSADRCTPNLDGECPDGVDNCCDPNEAGPGAEAGCLDDDATRQQVANLARAGIDTFVVGIPGSESYGMTLDALAAASNRKNPNAPPSYFAVDSGGSGATGLTGVLKAITTGLVTTCRLQLDSEPPDRLRLNVEVEGETISKGEDGWDLDEDTEPPTVVLLGETCRRVEEEGVESVNVVFGCPTVVE